MSSRMSWPEIRQTDEYKGRWVALDECIYDSRTGQPVEGSVVDADENLAELCNRMRTSRCRHCAILFCEEEEPEPTPRLRARQIHSRH